LAYFLYVIGATLALYLNIFVWSCSHSKKWAGSRALGSAQKAASFVVAQLAA